MLLRTHLFKQEIRASKHRREARAVANEVRLCALKNPPPHLPSVTAPASTCSQTNILVLSGAPVLLLGAHAFFGK